MREPTWTQTPELGRLATVPALQPRRGAWVVYHDAETRRFHHGIVREVLSSGLVEIGSVEGTRQIPAFLVLPDLEERQSFERVLRWVQAHASERTIGTLAQMGARSSAYETTGSDRIALARAAVLLVGTP